MISDIFKKEWEKLTPIQKEAAEWKDGPLLLLAGPGSGKTQVITCRIVNLLLNSPQDNFRILALTFTNAAADEMRKKIELFFPGAGNRLFIGTFHSFCLEILRKHGEHIGIKPDVILYSQREDLLEILKTVIINNHLEENFESYRLENVLDLILTIKSKLIPPDQITENLNFLKQFDPDSIKFLYTCYEEELTLRNCIDFSSLIFKSYQLLSKYPMIAGFYKRVYPYICIDEFQDTNQGQFQLLTQIIGEKDQNIFIVADDDQIIYQWNGADYQRLVEFKNKYCPEIMQIPTNFRCPPEIVKIANNLIQNNRNRMQCHEPGIPYKMERSEKTVKILKDFHSFEDEIKGVTTDILSLQVSFDNVVILARTKKLLDKFNKYLQNQNIPSVIVQRKDEFESIPMVWLYSIITLLHEPLNKRSLEKLCGTTYRIFSDSYDPDEIIQMSHENQTNYLNNWLDLATLHHSNFNDSILSKIKEYLDGRSDIIMLIENILEIIDITIIGKKEDNPSFDYPNYDEEKKVFLDIIQKIRHQHGKNIKIGLLLQELKLYSKDTPPTPQDIQLMTIHGSKGKEYDYVYIIGCVEDEIPSYYSIREGHDSSEMEEERRNCFVAITRTKKVLTFSYAKNYFGHPKKPSRFFSEMGLN